MKPIIPFRKFKPSPALIPFVKFLYVMELDEKGQGYSEATINHPQGGVDLIVVVNGSLGLKSGEQQQGDESGVFLVGQQQRYFSFSFKPNTRLFGAVFYPAGAHRWLTIPVSEATNTLRPVLDGELSGNVNRIHNEIWECSDPVSGIRRLDSWLCKSISHPESHLIKLDQGLQLIHAQSNIMRVNDLETIFSSSNRTLQRHFKRYYGLSPKQYLDVARFQHVMKALQEGRCSWDQLIEYGGYYDQSHFIRTFKKMTGTTPGDFIQKNPPLARLFLHS